MDGKWRSPEVLGNTRLKWWPLHLNLHTHIHTHTHVCARIYPRPSWSCSQATPNKTPLVQHRNLHPWVCMLCSENVQTVVSHCALFIFRKHDGSRKLWVCMSEINEFNLYQKISCFQRWLSKSNWQRVVKTRQKALPVFGEVVTKDGSCHNVSCKLTALLGATQPLS